MTLDQFRELALSRRSIRSYHPQSPPPDLIRELLLIATWSPSAHNRQPWRFVVLENTVTKHELANAMGAKLRRDLEADGLAEDFIVKDVERSYSRMTGAPILIVLCMSMVDMDTYADATRQQHEQTMAIQSTAMAGQNLMLAAHSAGLATCWMCAPLFSAEIVSKILRLPDDWQPQALISLGYPAQERERTRHLLEKSVLWR